MPKIHIYAWLIQFKYHLKIKYHFSKKSYVQNNFPEHNANLLSIQPLVKDLRLRSIPWEPQDKNLTKDSALCT